MTDEGHSQVLTLDIGGLDIGRFFDINAWSLGISEGLRACPIPPPVVI
jgi:hypothetical protein